MSSSFGDVVWRFCSPLSGDLLKACYVSRPELEEKLVFSIRGVLEEKFMRENSCGLIVVYGIGGSGKTTLVNKVLFDLGEGLGVGEWFCWFIVVRIVVRAEEERGFGRLSFSDVDGALRWVVQRVYDCLGFRVRVSDVVKYATRVVLGVGSAIPSSYVSVFGVTKEVVERVREAGIIVREKGGLGRLLRPRVPLSFTEIILSDFDQRIRDFLSKMREKSGEGVEYWLLVVVDDLSDVEEADRLWLLTALRELAKTSRCLCVVVYGYPSLFAEEESLDYAPRRLVNRVYSGAKLVEVSPVDQETLRKIVNSMGIIIDDDTLIELIEITYGNPRLTCIILNTIFLNKLNRGLDVEEASRVYLSDLEKFSRRRPREILEKYIDAICRHDTNRKEVLKLASCLPSFINDELKGILREAGGPSLLDPVRELKLVGLVEEWTEEIYVFKDNVLWLKNAVYYSLLSKDQRIEFHKVAIKYFRSQEKNPRNDEAIVYHCEKLIDLVKKEDEKKYYVSLLIDSAYRLSAYFYLVGFPGECFYYSRRVLEYGSEVGEWEKILDAAESILTYSVSLQLSKKEVDETVEKAKKAYNNLLKTNKEYAKAKYAMVKAREATYYLHVLRDREKAEEFISEAHRILGEEQEYIDKLQWLRAYLIILQVDILIALNKGDYEVAERKLKEWKNLVEKHRKELTEKEYYAYLAVIENTWGYLCFIRGEFIESRKHYVESLKHCIRIGDRRKAARSRLNIALIDFILAKTIEDYEKILKPLKVKILDKSINLNIDNCTKIFIKAKDLDSLTKAKLLKATTLITLNKLDEAEKETLETLERLKESPDNYFKAMALLHLAYLETLKALIEDNEKELKKAAGLTNRVCEVFYELRATSLAISTTLLSIQAYLFKEIDLKTLLEYINRLIKLLNKKKAYYQAGVLEIIKNELEERIKGNRGIDEEFLRLRGVKLLVVL